MQERYTDFKLAQKLKDKGFPQDCRVRYNKEGKLVYDFPKPTKESCSAVPLSVAQKWLRVEKHIHCEVHYEMNIDKYHLSIDNCETKTSRMPMTTFDDYEDALYKAIETSLNDL